MSSLCPQRSIGLPDVHSGYGFAIGNMAAFDMNDPDAVVSPGEKQSSKVKSQVGKETKFHVVFLF